MQRTCARHASCACARCWPLYWIACVQPQLCSNACCAQADAKTRSLAPFLRTVPGQPGYDTTGFLDKNPCRLLRTDDQDKSRRLTR